MRIGLNPSRKAHRRQLKEVLLRTIPNWTQIRQIKRIFTDKNPYKSVSRYAG